MTLYLTALILGLSGSWHCIAMCGPIALMVPGSKGRNRFIAITLYHSGKLLAYLAFGSIFGLIPMLTDSFFVQAVITVSAGILMLLIAFVPACMNFLEKHAGRFFKRYFDLRQKLMQSFKKDSPEYGFYIGFLNGFVPCGMVYMGALGAISQPDYSGSLLFMFFFGLGTIPAMTGFLFMAGFFKRIVPTRWAFARTVALVFVGVFMIWKGVAHLDDTAVETKAGSGFTVCVPFGSTH